MDAFDIVVIAGLVFCIAGFVGALAVFTYAGIRDRREAKKLNQTVALLGVVAPPKKGGPDVS